MPRGDMKFWLQVQSEGDRLGSNPYSPLTSYGISGKLLNLILLMCNRQNNCTSHKGVFGRSQWVIAEESRTGPVI